MYARMVVFGNESRLGLRKKIKKLMKAAPTCHICDKPCHPEDCVTDSQGRTLHKKCYREALIEGQESL